MRRSALQPPLIWHTYLVFALLGLFAALWPIPALAALLIAAFLDQRIWTLQRLGVALSVFLACYAHACWQFAEAEQSQAAAPAWLGSPKQRFCAQVKHSQGLPCQRLRIILDDIHTQDGNRLPGRCSWTWDEPEFYPLPGQKVCLTRPIKPVSGFVNDNYNSYRASLFAQGIYWRVWSKAEGGSPELKGEPTFWALARSRLFHVFMIALNPEHGEVLPQSKAILAALLFGDRFFLNQTTVRNFANAALAHSLALSGQHLGVAGLLAYFTVLLFGRSWPQAYLVSARVPLVMLASLPIALLYLWLGNSPPSLLRATLMLFFAGIWVWRSAVFTGIDVLCAAFAFILLFNPLAVFDTGLQLSVLCVAIIITIAPMIAKIYASDGSQPQPSPLFKRICGGALSLLIVSFAIQVTLLPLNLIRFQQAGFWFPLNLVWLPALGIIVLPLSIAGLAFSAAPFAFTHWLATLVLDAAALPCQLLLYMLRLLDAGGMLAETTFLLPHWTAILAFPLLLGVLGWICGSHNCKSRSKATAVLCIALSLLAVGPAIRLRDAAAEKISITALDVGQGEALLLELPGRLRLLLDGGGGYGGRFDPGRAIVAPQASANSSPRLAAVINSHPDIDHLGGLFYVIDNFSVGSVFHNGRKAGKTAEQTWSRQKSSPHAHILAAGDEIILGKPEDRLLLQVLHPPGNNTGWQGNSASLVLRLVWRGKGVALFPGDADRETLEYMLENNVNIQADLVVAPHHGSDKDMLPGFYQSVSPRLIIACCGYLNFRHYPGKKTRAWASAENIPLLDTGNHGKIVVEFSENGKMRVETAKPAKMVGDRSSWQNPFYGHTPTGYNSLF